MPVVQNFQSRMDTKVENRFANSPLSDEQVAGWRQRIRQETFANYHYHMGRALRKTDSLSEAANALERAITEQPDLFGAHLELLELLREAGKESEARAVEQRALAIDRQFAVKALRQRAVELFQETDDPVEASAILRTVAEQVPEWRTGIGEDLLPMARSLHSRGDFPRAADVFEAAMSYAPGDRKAAGFAIRTFYRLGAFEKAEQLCRTVLEGDEADADTLYCMAMVQASKGQCATALDLVRRALSAGMDAPEYGHLFAGRQLHILGDLEGATQDYDAAARNPGLAGILAGYRILLRLAGGRGTVAGRLDDPAVQPFLALAKWRDRAPDAARDLAAAAVTRMPKDPWALLVDGILSRASGAHEAGARRIEEARNTDLPIFGENVRLVRRSLPELAPWVDDLPSADTSSQSHGA